ncbi:ROK family protein [Streptomyces sp. NPDC048179]|uniref:ROK family transcriptional regulator n=1 Tax=Streptomyces sp. NPDC048179 TaxID=3365506 RepID=UPI003720A162
MNAPADSAAVRRGNLSLVLRHIAAHTPCARTEVAASTGLVHASVTALVADLMQRGLVREDGAATAGGRGRPRRLLRLVPERVRITAAHVGWGRIRVVTTGLAGDLPDVGHVRSAPGPFGPPEHLADAVGAAVTEAVSSPGSDVHPGALVIALASPVMSTGTHPAAPGAGRSASTLAALVAERLPGLRCPVEVVNDADMAALAEYHALASVPAERQAGTVAYVKSDAGVAGALLINGRVHHGSHGLAGELGHIPVALDGPRCRCGAHGCLSAYISTRAVCDAVGLADLASAQGPDAAVAALLHHLRNGEPRALAALDRAGHALGAAVQSVIGITDAEQIVLGGHLADWVPWLAPGIDARLSARRAAFPTARLTITPGTLGPRAALHGAVRTGRDRTFADPTTVPPARQPIAGPGITP